VIGEAADAASGIALVEQTQPELVLLDVALPDASGLDVAGRLSQGRSRVVLVSSRDPSDFGARLARSGAAGFIPKDELSGAVLAALLDEER